MTQKRARVTPANRTGTRLLERPFVAGRLSVFLIQRAPRGEGLASAAITGWQHAIEHINTESHGFDQVFRRADAHQVTRAALGHQRRQLLDYVKHYRLLFTHAKTADGIAVETDLHGARQTLLAEIVMGRSLHNAEQRLSSCGRGHVIRSRRLRARATLQTVESVSRSFGPSRGQLHAAARLFVRCLTRGAFIESHRYVGAERCLYFHRHFRPKKTPRAAQM